MYSFVCVFLHVSLCMCMIYVCVCDSLVSMANTVMLCQEISSRSSGSTVINDPEVISKYPPGSLDLSIEYLVTKKEKFFYKTFFFHSLCVWSLCGSNSPHHVCKV